MMSIRTFSIIVLCGMLVIGVAGACFFNNRTVSSQQQFMEAQNSPPPLPYGQTPDGNGPPPLPYGQVPDGSGPPPLPYGQTPDGNGPPPLPYGGVGNMSAPQPPPGGQMGPGNGPPPPPPGSSNEFVRTTGAYTQTSGKTARSGQKLSSTKTNESVIKICKSGKYTLTGSTLTKTGDNQSSNESCDFYGLNAVVLAESGGMIHLSDCKIQSNAAGANAVFSTGTGSSVALSNVSINTTGRGSARGLDATMGGSITASNANITTSGEHCAAIATDRGGGNITVNGGSMNTNGQGSPGVYSTGNISVSNARMISNNSEAAVIEGKNSINLVNCSMLGKKQWGVMLYQSFSGDAEIGTSVFTMKGGSLTAEEGPIIYTTNTTTRAYLSGVKLASKSGNFLIAAAGRWGNTGSNGSNIALVADRQNIRGDIICDKISRINATLKNRSILKGSINAENTAGYMVLKLDKSSVWMVTGNSYIISLTDSDKTFANIIGCGYIVYYDPAASKSLANKTYTLKGGGKLTPKR